MTTTLPRSGERVPVSTPEGLVVRFRTTLAITRSLVPDELSARFRQSALRSVWAILGPVVVVLVYGLVLTQGFGVQGAGVPYLTSAWTGLVLWTFFATAAGTAVASIVSAADLVTKLRFPMEALPLGAVGAALVDLGVGTATILVLMVVQGVRPGLWAFASVLPVVMIALWTAAFSVAAAVLAALWRDTIHGVGLLLRVGFFATPVMYDATQLPHQLAWTARLNPLAVAITEVRNTLLRNTAPSPRLLSAHLAVACLALLTTLAWARTMQPRVVDTV